MSNLSEKIDYKQKYLKYKAKYLQLKAQLGGTEKCSSKGLAKCALTVGCGWSLKKNMCVAKPCEDYNRLTCGAVPGCSYNSLYGEEKCEGCDRIGRCANKPGCTLVDRVCTRIQAT
jgi:hypothetical protein